MQMSAHGSLVTSLSCTIIQLHETSCVRHAGQALTWLHHRQPWRQVAKIKCEIIDHSVAWIVVSFRQTCLL
jgi:hypothetical protein